MIKGIIVAFQFLSRIPIPISVDFNSKNLKMAKFFFPLVGIVLGGLVGGVVHLLMGYSLEVAALLGVVLNILLTGGLHIDGLSDMCDGFFSNKDRERMIEIMHDSRVGSFGVLSTVLLILWKFIMYKSLGVNTFTFILLSGMFSRMSVQYMISMKKLAVPGGMGDMIRGENSLPLVALTFLFYGVATMFINPLYIIPLVCNMILVELISRLSYRKIGGVSGDIYGATVELSEAFNLLCFWGLMQWI